MQKAIPPDEAEADGMDNAADLWYNIGIGHHASDNYEEALTAYEKAREAYLKMNNEKLAYECLGKSAVCHHLLGNLKEAAVAYLDTSRYHKQCATASDANEEDEAVEHQKQALLLSNATNIYSEVGDMEKCAACMDELLEVCQSVRDKQVQAKIYHDIGLVYIAEGHHQSSAEVFEQSLKCLKHMKRSKRDRSLEGTVLQNLGAAYNYMEMYDHAVKYHRMAVDCYGQLNDRRSQAQVLSNLAYAQSQCGDYFDSLTSFMHCVQVAKDCADKRAQLMGMEGLAAIFFRLKKYKKATELYKETLVLIAEVYNRDKDKETDHASRIVEKLADTIQCQIEEEFRTSSGNSTPARVTSPRETLPTRIESPVELSKQAPMVKSPPVKTQPPPPVPPVQLANPQLNSFMMDVYPNSSAFLEPGVSPVPTGVTYDQPPQFDQPPQTLTIDYDQEGFSNQVHDGGGLQRPVSAGYQSPNEIHQSRVPIETPVTAGYQRQGSYTRTEPPARGLDVTDMRPASAPYQHSGKRYSSRPPADQPFPSNRNLNNKIDSRQVPKQRPQSAYQTSSMQPLRQNYNQANHQMDKVPVSKLTTDNLNYRNTHLDHRTFQEQTLARPVPEQIRTPRVATKSRSGSSRASSERIHHVQVHSDASSDCGSEATLSSQGRGSLKRVKLRNQNSRNSYVAKGLHVEGETTLLSENEETSVLDSSDGELGRTASSLDGEDNIDTLPATSHLKPSRLIQFADDISAKSSTSDVRNSPDTHIREADEAFEQKKMSRADRELFLAQQQDQYREKMQRDKQGETPPQSSRACVVM